MKNFLKGKIGTIVVLVVTLVLAGVAIFTALRLYQLRQTAVAPNAPTSIPKADTFNCRLQFTLTPAGGVTCSSKKVYIAANNTSTITDKNVDFALGDEITDGGNVAPGQEIIYVIGISETNGGLTYTTTDVLDSDLTYINYSSTDNCSFNTTTQTVSCPGTDTGRTGVQVKIKAKVKESLTSGTIANTASVKAGQNAAVSCDVSLTISTSTGSPSPTGSGSPTPTGSGTPSPSGTPNSCGGTCGSNLNCASNLICYQGFCRNPSCQTDTDCVCPAGTTPTGSTSTGSATPAPSLPESGTGWPTIVGGAIGVFVIIGALLLAL